MRVLRFALAFLGVAAALVPSAGATVVVQRGMAGVRIGMSEAAVRGVLGEPLRARHGTNDFGPFTELRYPNRIRVTLQGGQAVTAISTTGRAERTARGVGVGSTEAEVTANVARVRCESFGSFRQCTVGTFRPGTRATVFDVRAGAVTRVTVGIVID